MKDIKKILIVGGGASGWWAAGYFEAKFPDMEITLLESDVIPTIGVGESTLPMIGPFLQEIGIKEEVWMPQCNAVYKYGNLKQGWDKADGEMCPFTFWFNHNGIFDDWAKDYLDGKITKQDIVDNFYSTAKEKMTQTEREATRAYHLDANLAGSIVKNHCKNVKHLIGTIDELPPGYDLYLDCTGFRRQFIKDHKVITNEHHLVDRAVVCQYELKDDLAYTQSIARKYGWQFIINLTNRTGTGYVYSSKHISDEDALAEFNELNKDRIPYQNKTPRVIKWTPEYLSNPWTDDVVAIGLSAGMLDPLEANALYMTQLSIVMVAKCIKRGYNQRTYNRMMRNVWKDNSDFILHHYMLTSRDDTSFWEHYSKCDVRKSLWEHYEAKKDIQTNLYPDSIWANLGMYYDEFTFYKKT